MSLLLTDSFIEATDWELYEEPKLYGQSVTSYILDEAYPVVLDNFCIYYYTLLSATKKHVN